MFESILTTPLAEALGWTLVNFVWQGTLAAALLAAANFAMRRSAPESQYRMACAALLFMLVAAGATFWHLLDALSVRHAPRLDYIIYSTAAFDSARPSSVISSLIGWVDRNLAYGVMVWLAGVGVLSLRLAGGWLVIRRLKRVTEPVSAAVQARVNDLRSRLAMSRSVRVLSSALVHVPMVVGWLKPVVLLPVSVLSGLTMRELEALIAHELSHIKRFDYLVNGLQTLAETVFFYHPAVWWVSRRIRIEREHCCDDLTLRLCGDAARYATALLFVEERCPGDRTFSLRPLGVGAADGSLLSRVGRIVKPGARPEASSSRFAAGLGVVLILAGCSAASRVSVSPASPYGIAPVEFATLTRFLGVDGPTVITDLANLTYREAPALPTSRPARADIAPRRAASAADGLRQEAPAERRVIELDPFAVRAAPPPDAPTDNKVIGSGEPTRRPAALALGKVSSSGAIKPAAPERVHRFAIGLSGGVLRSANAADRPLSPNFEARGILDVDPMTSIEFTVSYSALRDSSTFRYPGPDGLPVDLSSQHEKQVGVTLGIRRAASEKGTNNGLYYGFSAGLLKVPINRVIGTEEDSADEFASKLGYFLLPKIGYAARRHSALSLDISTGLSFTRVNGLDFVQPMISMGLNYWL